MTIRLASVVCAAILALAEPVRAERPAAEKGSVAEALFREGKKLMSEKHFSEACPKLAESQRLDPGGGTLLMLALCHESLGLTASAWAELNEAIALAVKDGRADRKAVAEKRVAALEPRLSKLTIHVAASVGAIEGLEILRDGIDLGRPAWGVATPVDPGDHRIEVRAPGRRGWSTDVSIDAEADSKDVNVPELELEPEPSVAPVPRPAKAARVSTSPRPVETVRAREAPADLRDDDTRRIVAVALGGVGLVAVGVGSYFGIASIRDAKEADRRCPDSRCGDEEAVELNEQAGTAADISTVAFVTGGVAIGAAVFFVW